MRVREVPALNAFCFLERHPTVQKPLRDCLAEAEVVEREKISFALRAVFGNEEGLWGRGGACIGSPAAHHDGCPPDDPSAHSETGASPLISP